MKTECEKRTGEIRFAFLLSALYSWDKLHVFYEQRLRELAA